MSALIPSEVLDTILDDDKKLLKELFPNLKTMMRLQKPQTSLPHLKKGTMLDAPKKCISAMMNVNILEGLRFYVHLLVSLYLAN